MTEQDVTLTLANDDLSMLLEATLPDGPGYGRRKVDKQAQVTDIHGVSIIASGQPGAGRGLFVAALAETAMTLETLIWEGLEQAPTSARVFWGSRFGMISTTEANEHSTTLNLSSGGTLYEQVFDAIGLGPRAVHSNNTEVPVRQRLVSNIGPGADESKRNAALDELVRLTAEPMPEIASHLAAGRVRFLALSIKLFSMAGLREEDLFWIDTPAGILVPQTSGGLFTRTKYALATMPPWAAWQNILERLPSSQDIELWHDLAEDSASDRIAFDPGR